MRPIVKGTWPTDANATKVVFEEWGEAKPYLIDRTGRYCHFCEMPILNSPAVEHIKNKQFYPNVKNHWDNLMLCCTYCNSRKPKKRIKLYDYYWPHIHNTFLALGINQVGIIIVKSGLSENQRRKAEDTIKLYGLHEITDSTGGIDSRYEARITAISHALQALEEYKNENITLNAIIRDAQSSGFWSIWFTVFEHYPEVKKALIDHFNGTANCFDPNNNYQAIPRQANDL